jgi:hypothetical protein
VANSYGSHNSLSRVTFRNTVFTDTRSFATKSSIYSLSGYCITSQSTFCSTLAPRVRSSIFPIVGPSAFPHATLASSEAELGASRLAIHALDGATLSLDGHALRSDGIYAVDLTHVNEGLVTKGASRVQGVLGADISDLSPSDH